MSKGASKDPGDRQNMDFAGGGCRAPEQQPKERVTL